MAGEIKISGASAAAPGSRPAENLPFRIGEILRGTVAEESGPGTVVLRLSGRRIVAETQIPLPKDVELRFEVQEAWPNVILRFIPEESLPSSLVKKYLAADLPAEMLAGKLVRLFQDPPGSLPPEVHRTWKLLEKVLRGPATSSGSSGANPWQEILLKSGLFWERKMRRLFEGGKEGLEEIGHDLKGLAAKLLAELRALPEKERAPLEDLIRGLEGLKEKIELLQILNLRHAAREETISFLLPLWFGEALHFIELKLSLPHAQTGQDEGVSLLFLLQLPAWGRMRIAVKMREKDLYACFFLSDAQGADFLRSGLPRLARSLGRLGFKPQLNLCLESPGAISATLLQETEEGGDSFLNVSI